MTTLEMTVSAAGGPGLVQERRLVTEIPGPRSRELALRSIAATSAGIGEVRCRGAMLAAELVRPGTRDPNPDAVAAVSRYCHNHGVLTLTAGTFGNVLRFMPPLSISDDLLHEALGILADAFRSL